uniref:Retrovirus-related Pol polyprotein from transposon TNT 1-94 n=1 Tax=Tanacetum cinerariifolium TaxID=118510 RepID=A0A6L2N2Y3_TANCI|nr:retrovirus-related Pol polyprotein from transposon TNT 1-94 [Tanacetum cinerariifolium]
MPTDNTNNATITNVAQNVVNEDVSQLLDSRGENGPFLPMSPLSTSTNPLTKPLNQWSPKDVKLANQDKRLKSIIISCLPNDVMKSIIKCTTAKAIWTDLILAHEGPSDIRDTNIAALRIKFNAFKALEGEKVQETYTRLKVLLNDLENKGVSIPQAEIDAMSKGQSKKGLVVESFDWDEESVSSKDEWVTRVKAFMAIVEDEPSVRKADARSDYTHVDLHYVDDQRKILLSKFNFLSQELSSYKSELADLKNTNVINCSLQNDIAKLNLENESQRDEISDLKKVIEKWTSSKVTLDQLLTEQVHGNVVHALGGRGKSKEQISLKEVLFTKADESPTETAPEITFDSKSECDIQESLPYLPKLIEAEPNSTSVDAPMIPKPFKDYKYYGLNNHHSDECEYYLGCDICGSVAHEIVDCTKKPSSNNRKLRIANKRSTEPIEKSSNELGPKVVFEDNSSGDTERGRSLDISYFYVFGCPVHIHNHRDHLGKFNAKADDGFFLGYSLVAKAFMAFIIRRKEIEETYHVRFSEDDEAISKSSTKGDEINFNENRSFPDDEFLVPRNTVSQGSKNNDYFPYVPSFDHFSTNNITILDPSAPFDLITSSDTSDTHIL